MTKKLMSVLIRLKIISLAVLLITTVFPCAILFILFPLNLYRLLIHIWVKVFRPDLVKSLPPYSKLFSYDDLYHNPGQNICVPIVLEGIAPLHQIRDLIQQKIISRTTTDGQIIFPELRQHVQAYGGFKFWAWDKNFTIEKHVQEICLKSELLWANKEDVERFISGRLTNPWNPQESPWEWLVLNNYSDDLGATRNCFLILKIHHCVADGYSILSLFDLITTGDKLFAEKSRTGPALRSGWRQKLALPIRMYYDFIETAVTIKPDINLWNVERSRYKKSCWTTWSNPITVEEIKQIKNRLNVKFQSVVFGIMAGAVRSMMKDMGQRIPGEMTIFVPLPVTQHSGGLAVESIPVLLKLPVGEASPTKRIAMIESSLQKITVNSGATKIMHKISQLLGYLPGDGYIMITKNHLITLTVTSFPSFQNQDVWINGQKCLGGFFTAGTGRGTCGATFAALSLAGNLTIGLTIRQVVIPEQEQVSKLSLFVEEELKALSDSRSLLDFDDKDLLLP